MKELASFIRPLKRRVDLPDGTGYRMELAGFETVTVEIEIDLTKLCDGGCGMGEKLRNGASKATLAAGAIVAKVVKREPFCA